MLRFILPALAGAVIALLLSSRPQPQQAEAARFADLSGYQVLQFESKVNMDRSKQLQVKCPPGKRALGAGWGVVDPTGAMMEGRATYSMPASDGSGWLVNAEYPGPARNWKLQIWMICADIE